MNTTQLNIEGMTCGHCVAAVTKALKAVPGVQAAQVDLATGSATITHEGASLAALTQAVEEEGYGVR